MQNWKVEVYYKPEVPDTIGQGILEDITDLGISGVDSVAQPQFTGLKAHLMRRLSTELARNFSLIRLHKFTPSNLTAMLQ